MRVERLKQERKGQNGQKQRETQIHVPLLQHKSPKEADHRTSCRTGLLIRQSVHARTHTNTQQELDPFHLLPGQTVLLMVKTAIGIPMSETK